MRWSWHPNIKRHTVYMSNPSQDLVSPSCYYKLCASIFFFSVTNKWCDEWVYFITDQMYKIYRNENRLIRVNACCQVNPSTTPLLVIKKDTKNVRWSSYLWYYEFFVCQTFFFTKNVSIGTSVRLFVKGVHIPSTLITKYHTPLYLPLFFIQFYFLVWSLAAYRGNCVRPLL